MYSRKGYMDETYEILGYLGSGSGGVIYKAYHKRLQKEVVLKKIKRKSRDARINRNEVDILKNLNHMYLPQVVDFFEENGEIYTAMSFIPGRSLKELMEERRQFSQRQLIRWAMQLCSALNYLHTQTPPIIHGDIKPANIMVTPRGDVCLIDFNVSFAVNGNTVLGYTEGYASPEQYIIALDSREGRELPQYRVIDEKSDIYSLGITMYEMVTGHVPFDHENGVTIALMHLQNEITPPSQVRDGIPDSLEKIILKCTMKKPEDRYQTADELIADLKLVFEDTSGEYVGIVPTIDDSPTIMIDQNELTQRIQTNDDTQPVEDSDSNAYLEEDDEEEETGMNSKIEKLVIVLAAVVGAIILISIVVFVVKSSGLFRSGKSTTQSTIAATTEAKHHNTTEKYTVDNYIGLSLEAAREAIDNKFKINVTEEYSDTYAKGLVMQQDPESDTELEEGKTIKLVVSKGQKIEDKVSVPDVRSKTKSGAQSELKAAGLKVSIKEAYSDDVAKGEVISQTPSHGSKVSKNTTVVITVSKGKKEDQTVSVPYLRYYTESEASQELQRVGLSLGSVLTEYSDSVEKGLVIRQRISSGSKVKKGTAVGIYVSLGPRQTATTADEESTTTGEE